MDSEFTFDLSAASWRHSIADEKSYVEALATRLENALPGKVVVRRESRLFSKIRNVSEIQVKFDTVEYKLSFTPRNGVRTEKAKVVRGICLKTDELAFSEWLDELSQELTKYARQHENVRAGLERFLLS